MSKRTRTRGLRWLGGFIGLIGIAGGLSLLLPEDGFSDSSEIALENLPRAAMRKTDLSLTLRTGGLVESGQHTLIECELEQISERTIGGGRLNTSGYSTIIYVIPDGSHVKKGDILCELDSSEYEELVRQQQLEMDDAKIEYEQARLDFEKAQVSLLEYRDGLRIQQYQEYEGQIALAESDLQRQKDRMEWTKKMLPLGYISPSQYEQEKLNLLRYQIALSKVQDALESYKKYTEPKMIQILEADLEKAETNLAFSLEEVADEEESLARYQLQVENCTIRAPHAGLVIYANDDDEPLREGAQAHRRMDLFYLPDLDQMEIQAILDQTVVRQVEAGMTAKVRVEAYPGREFSGTIVKVESLPYQSRGSWARPDVKEYVARIRIDGESEGLLPGMNAEIEILTTRKDAALVVPSHALAVEDGVDVCYVLASGGLERREVSIGGSTITELEVLGGLSEGEEVLLEPFRYDPDELPVVESSLEVAENSEWTALL